jgi:hypothetical protein
MINSSGSGIPRLTFPIDLDASPGRHDSINKLWRERTDFCHNRYVRSVSVVLFTLLVTLPALTVELFRYRGSAKDGGTLEYLFETDKPEIPKTITHARAAEIAANFMTVFYQIQVGSLETQEYNIARSVLVGVLF